MPNPSLAGLQRGAATLLAALLVFTACATPQTQRDVSVAERSDYAAALAALSRDRRQGVAALRSFVTRYPESSLADDAALRLAELAEEAGQPEEALRRLDWLLANHPDGDQSERARLLTAQLELARGRPGAADRALAPLRLSLLSRQERGDAHRLLARVAHENGDAVGELRWLARVRADQENEEAAAAVDAQIDALLGYMSWEELEQAAEQLGRRILAARVRLRQGELALTEGDLPLAQSALERASRLPLTPPDEPRLAALEARIEAGEAGRDPFGSLPGFDEVDGALAFDPASGAGTLGVALPLSGRYAAFGEESLQGILLATGLFDATRPTASRTRLIVRDTGGTAEGAARAVAELAAIEDVVAILGPLLAVESEAAAPLAEQAGVPLLTLTRREEVAEGREFVLRFGAAPRAEAELLADYAVRELGATRFAILYPDDRYGRSLRGVFWDAVEARGGRVVGVARYAPDATDFAQPIRRLIGFELLSPGAQTRLDERKKLLKRAKRMPPEKAAELRAQAAAITGPNGQPLPPFVDFDALFIPDSHQNVSLIAPHLAFHEVRGVRLLGSSAWNHPSLLRIGGRHVDGAVFTASFFPDSSFPFVAEFSRRYRATFERDPSFLAAQAFDAATLAGLQLIQGRDRREELVAGLLATRAFPGVSGITSLRPDGNADKRPHLLGVDRGRLISIDETHEPPYLRPRLTRPAARPSLEPAAALDRSSGLH